MPHARTGPHKIRLDVPFWVAETSAVYQERGKVPGCLTSDIEYALTFGTREECAAWIAFVPRLLAASGYATRRPPDFVPREHIMLDRAALAGEEPKP